MLTCPNDKSDLTLIKVEDVPIDQCPTCGGYWLDRGELEALGEKHGAHLKPIKIGDIAFVDSVRNCPHGHGALHRHDFAEHTGIAVEQCPTCLGIWLEMDDLTTILNYLDRDQPYTEPTLSEQVMLFLYQLTEHPPVY